MPPAPLLLELLFPESAESVLPLVSPRLLDWCSAFGAWLRWGPGEKRLPLPAEAWEAIRQWLEQSGRLPLMQPGDFIFTPLADPLKEADPDRPEAWASGKFISYDRLLDNLRLYGWRLGLPEEKLNRSSLRLTALRLDAVDRPEALYRFLDRKTEMSKMPARRICGPPDCDPSRRRCPASPGSGTSPITPSSG